MLRTLHLVILAAAPSLAQAAPPAPTVPVPPVTIDATLSGQKIRPPQGDMRVTIGRLVIPPGGGLPPHKHPYPRVVHIEAGRLKVTNLDTGQVREVVAGEWVVDAVDQWHEAAAVGDEPVRLLTIDEAPPGAAVTIPKPR